MESAYIIPGNAFTNAQDAQWRLVRTGPTKPDPICSPGVVALTEPQTDFTPNEPVIQIILCPLFFDSNNWRQTIAANPAPTDVVANYRFAASAFIHELFHVLGNQYESHLLTDSTAGC